MFGEFATFYTDVEWNEFNLRTVQCRGLQHAGIPLEFRGRIDNENRHHLSAFTTDSQTRSEVANFEEQLGLTQRMYLTKLVDEGSWPILSDFLNNGADLANFVASFQDLRDMTKVDEIILQRAFLTAFQRGLTRLQNIEGSQAKKAIRTYRRITELSLPPLRAVDLNSWVAKTYQLMLPDFPELKATTIQDQESDREQKVS